MPLSGFVAGNMAYVASLNPDIWLLILQNVRIFSITLHCSRKLTSTQVDDRRDLYSLCLVSKSLYPLATKFLYRNLLLGPRPLSIWDEPEDDEDTKPDETQWAESLAMVRRLAADPSGAQAHAVREVELAAYRSDPIQLEYEKEDALAAFVKALPNLRHFRFVVARPKTGIERVC